MLVVTFLSLVPTDQLPGTTPSDKLNHLLAFSVLAWLADGAYPGRRLEPYRWALLLAYGLMIEVIQAFLPYRDFSLLDLAADAAGILCYSLFVRLRPLGVTPSD